MNPSAVMELSEDTPLEAAIVRLFHGTCLESEVKVVFIDKGRVLVSLTEKKEQESKC